VIVKLIVEPSTMYSSVVVWLEKWFQCHTVACMALLHGYPKRHGEAPLGTVARIFDVILAKGGNPEKNTFKSS
jgi:hypothetical protein